MCLSYTYTIAMGRGPGWSTGGVYTGANILRRRNPEEYDWGLHTQRMKYTKDCGRGLTIGKQSSGVYMTVIDYRAIRTDKSSRS